MRTARAIRLHRSIGVCPAHARSHILFTARPTLECCSTVNSVHIIGCDSPTRTRKQLSEVTGMVFQPFSEVQGELSTVTQAPITESYARVDYHPECEAAINEQINIEYTISYVYHALHSYFGRDNVGLPGFAKFFAEASDEERDHAKLLMDYQSKRGGRVELKPLAAPEMEFSNDDKGDALYAMELALSLEKLNFQKLQTLHAVGDKHSDAALCDFVEGDLLQDQVDAVKEHAVYVSQLRRVGKGVGVYLFDQELAENEAA